MEKIRLILALVTVGCIVGPIGAVVFMNHNDLSQIVLTPKLQHYINLGNNNSNNNNQNTANGQNNNNSNGNSGNSYFSNSGNVNNNNPSVNGQANSFGGSGEFDVTGQVNGNSVSGQVEANINCLVEQSGNNIQLSIDLNPVNVTGEVAQIFGSDNDYLFNFAGSTVSTNSGAQITANAQGSMGSAGNFDIDLNGTMDQNQDSLALTFSTQNAQAQFSLTAQTIYLYPNGNSNNGGSNNENNNNSGGNSNNNNSNEGLSPSFVSGEINTSQKTITLSFSLSNNMGQDTTLSAMSGTIETTNGQYQLGTVSLSGSVTVPAGQTITVTASGSLTQNGLNSLNQHFSQVSSIDVSLINGQMTEDGVTGQSSGTQDLGSVNISR